MCSSLYVCIYIDVRASTNDMCVFHLCCCCCIYMEMGTRHKKRKTHMYERNFCCAYLLARCLLHLIFPFLRFSFHYYFRATYVSVYFVYVQVFFALSLACFIRALFLYQHGFFLYIIFTHIRRAWLFHENKKWRKVKKKAVREEEAEIVVDNVNAFSLFFWSENFWTNERDRMYEKTE